MKIPRHIDIAVF